MKVNEELFEKLLSDVKIKAVKEQLELAQLFIDSAVDPNKPKGKLEVVAIDYGKGPYGGKIFCKGGYIFDIGGRYVRELQDIVGDNILAEIKKRQKHKKQSV
jgi:hypothetical protein